MRKKSPAQVNEQTHRLWNRRCRLARLFAAKAHPETGGNLIFVRSWGNEAAKAAVARQDARYNKTRPIADRMYKLAEHNHWHSPAFRPLWCKHCHQQE